MRSWISKIFFLPLALATASPLMAQDQMAARGGSMWQTLFMVGLAVLFFYFILWRPERKRRKQMDQQRASMKKGDHIVAMGILGTVDRVKEKSVIVKMVDGAKIEFLMAAISEVRPKTVADEDVVEAKVTT